MSIQCVANDAKDAKDTSVHYFVTPNTCIARSEALKCEMEVAITWTFSQAGDYCLYQDEIALKCWTNVTQIQEKFMMHLQHDTNLSLTDRNRRLIEQQKIKVVYATSQQYRRKLRSEWSIF